MKNGLFLSSLCLFSFSVFAEVDFSHCQSQFNVSRLDGKKRSLQEAFSQSFEAEKDNHPFFPFELTKDGKVKPHPSVNLSSKGNVDILTVNSDGTEYEVVINKNDKDEVLSVTTEWDFSKLPQISMGFGAYGPNAKTPPKLKKPAFKRTSATTVKLDYKNGKCFPARIDTINTFGDESRQDVTFDAKLCRDIQQFFKKHPEAQACFDSGLMTKADNIFSDFYKNNQDIYSNDDDSTISGVPKSVNTKLKSESLFPTNVGMGGGYPGIGIGFGGFTPMSSDQALTPWGPTVDGIIAGSKLNGYVNKQTSVMAAMQLKHMCETQWGTNTFYKISHDDALWALEAPKASTTDSETVTR